jgi:hypothetical protein
MFELIISKVRKLGERDFEDETVGEAIESIYSMDEDDMHVNWNGYLIGMSLKYDVSDIFNDIIKMIRALNLITRGCPISKYTKIYASVLINTPAR